ncbi:MAG: hypothetical protein IKI52_05685 [Clostridia bacterium]|nr:hypothetical protein [Clostridia bacterium]
MLTRNLLKNPERIEYCSEVDIVPALAKKLQIPKLDEIIRDFREHPVKEGITLHGARRTSVKLFMPNLCFDEQIEMGDSVWLYMGDLDPIYCIFVPWDQE